MTFSVSRLYVGCSASTIISSYGADDDEDFEGLYIAQQEFGDLTEPPPYARLLLEQCDDDEILCQWAEINNY